MPDRRQRTALLGDEQPMMRAHEVAQKLNEGRSLRDLADEIGVSAAGIHRLMREAGYELRKLWVHERGLCKACGAPNAGGYVTPGCQFCVVGIPWWDQVADREATR